ncbi:phosphotransferase family protein [Bacillus sp. N9]
MPYIIDDSQDIFGWSYSLMPRLRGEYLYSKHQKATLSVNEKLKISELISKTLAEFHTWTVNECGELNTENFNINRFKEPYVQWLYKRIIFWLEDARKYSIITSNDFQWVENLLEDSKEAFNHFTAPTFVMGDFKPGNFLLHLGDRGWEISGVFDFTNSYFADPISDLIKMIIFYLDNNEYEMAKHLVRLYCSEFEEKEYLIKRINVHMLHQRILDWGCAKATNMVTWDRELSFSHWIEAYTDSVANF